MAGVCVRCAQQQQAELAPAARTWMPSAEMRRATSPADQADTSRKCSASASMRDRHSEPSGGDSA
jgi:hypothetical protein